MDWNAIGNMIGLGAIGAGIAYHGKSIERAFCHERELEIIHPVKIRLNTPNYEKKQNTYHTVKSGETCPGGCAALASLAKNNLTCYCYASEASAAKPPGQ